jgi:transposase
MSAKKPSNHGKPWTPQEDRKLERLAGKNTPTGLIAYELQRTEDAVRTHASEEGVSLKPTNQSPYNRRKK